MENWKLYRANHPNQQIVHFGLYRETLYTLLRPISIREHYLAHSLNYGN